MNNFIKEVFKDVIENSTYNKLLVNKYFNENYIQIVDGHTFDFEKFNQHLIKLKSKISNQSVKFENIIASENYIFTKHLVESTLTNGEIIKHKVFAEFEIKDGKIIRCDELTMLLSGNRDEENLGSEI